MAKYEDKKQILKNLTLSIEAGKTVALVGPSGGGKTTLCNLIPRFYDFNEGDIKIDGISVKEVSLKSLRKNIGVVQQDVFLFTGTKKENIVLFPGICFGKTFVQNLVVLKRLKELQDLGYPILLGTSRKSVLGNIVGGEPKERVEATVATTVSGIRDGVDIVRVHDVKENIQAAKVADKFYRG